MVNELNWFLENIDYLLGKYLNKVLVIKDLKIIGVFDDELEAMAATRLNHKPGSFIIQRCDSSLDAYKQQYTSRVSFENK